MMILRKLAFYAKNQWYYLLKLQIVFVLPLFLFLNYSSYPLPNVEYVVMTCLFVSQYALVGEASFAQRFEVTATKQLLKENAKQPSKSLIIKRLQLMREGRSLMVALSLLSLWILSLAY